MKIIFTSATIKKLYNERVVEYQASFDKISEFDFDDKVQILECTKEEGVGYLEKMKGNVFFSKTHNPNIKNKGVKEAMALMELFKNADFDDDEQILKITGRYMLQSSEFLNLVEKNEFDCYLTRDDGGQVFFGCFSMKFKLFKQMLNSFDLLSMEKEMINIEKVAADFIDKNRLNEKRVEKINILCNINHYGIVKF